MELKNIIAIFVVLFQFNWVVICSPTWGDPPVQAPAAFEHNETIWRYAEEAKTLYMNIDEAIEVPFDLIVINCNDCDVEEPKFGKFTTGSSAYLGGNIIKREDQFILQLTELQDYDVEVAREFSFQLFFESNEDEIIYVILKIIDIDNRPPTIKLKDRSCFIPENEPGLGRSNCTFDISDRDTPLKDLRYPLPRENDVDKHFEIVLNESTIVGQTGEAYLNVIQELDFETIPTYYFDVRAEDPPKNPGSTPDQIAVKVVDMPDEDPVWKRIKTTETLKEEETQDIRIFAKDGDVEIDAEIDYEFDRNQNEPCHDSITVAKDQETKEGVITVDKIDRDEPELKDNTIKCRIVAFEKKTPSAKVSEVISFIIEDINDNIPKINVLKDLVEINEAEFTSIPDVFLVTDIDQGQNAQFDVILRDVGDVKFSEAFRVIPFSGYRNWSFSLSVTDADKLDYEQIEWQNFELEIYSKDQGVDPQHDIAKISIKLINMNNKPPKFVDNGNNFIVQIYENANKTETIIQLEATDEDTDDKVTFGLTIGDQNFEIVPEPSESAEKANWFATVITKVDNVFDYEKQKQVVIQISATDELTPGTIHTVVQQITIEVLDVNDESPMLTLPNDTPEIKEHQDVGSAVTPNFKAIDVDTTAELEFKIIWDESYATRQGRRVDIEKFQDVFTIKTTFEVDDERKEKKGYADGTLIVNDNSTLDYEEYEIIYLKIQVQDMKQEMGIAFDSAIMAVTIIDINDHAPQFTEISINSPKFVTENSASGTLIGSIIAIDPDGPGYNNVFYSIEPRDNTKKGLVKIDEDSGELTVDKDKAIDADCPNTYELYYTVTATDSELENATEIFITVYDVNDIDPSLVNELQSPFDLKEGNYSNKYLQTIDGIDFDRDNPNNNISYYLNGQFDPTLHDYFNVDEISGKICANNTFIWSEEREKIKVDLIIKDSFGGNEKPRELSISFDVIIEDINDNSPILDQNINLKASEDDSKDKLLAKIEANDKDKPCTLNTQINYKIDEILDPNKDVVTKEILKLENKHEGEDKKCKYYANLYTNMALREYYGTYSVCIIAENIGKEELNNRHCYDLVITPYNFKPPKMIFPLNGATIVLDKDQTINKKLLTPDGSPLTDFEATDDQGGKFTMVLQLKENWNDMFILKGLGQNNKAQLQLKERPGVNDKKITLTVEAEHNGIGSAARVVQSSFTIYFIDKSELPYFEGETDVEFEITENEKDVCRTFNKAVDGKCIENPDCGFKIYYYQTEENEKKFFTLHETEPQLCIKNPLDREEFALHNLTIYASNTPNSPPNIGGLPNTPLNITIKVLDVNDNAPVFDPTTYDGGITTQTTINTAVVRHLTATDIDTIDDGRLRYTIVESSFVPTGSNLESINSPPFKIYTNTQDIVNTFQPQAKMSGYFSFTVRVFDSDDLHDDNATVKILIISEVNQIDLNFANEVEDVRSQKRSIEGIFSEELEYTCVIDNTVEELNEFGTPKKNSTIVIAHFIDDEKHEAADKTKVTEAIELNEQSITKRLKALDLHFTNITRETLSDIKSSEELLETLLIVVSVVLGTLIIVLIIAFVLRTRSLNQRIASMTTNVFGSTKSDLNRIGTNAPGTNRHAVEANPVWNEEINDMNHFDTISQASGGSDLIGIEDNPEFQYNRKDSINPGFEQNNNITFDDDDNDDDDVISLPGASSNNQFKFA